ncbi:MAG: hypothetical protein E6Q89_06015 [Bacteroidia bacterium]|nr:MAG: hypothetical protein E6Q89_06015 [Bacteroidia bacterium]
MSANNLYHQVVGAIPNFKIRSSQEQMVNEIDNCFKKINLRDAKTKQQQDSYDVLMVEAPTGTGKSLAYLIGALGNLKNWEVKLVISTATLALQGQLVNLDIPNFIKHSGLVFKYGLAKGRTNYLCPSQLEIAMLDSQSDLFNSDEGLKSQLYEIYELFIAGVWNGDLDALTTKIDYQIKKLITTDKERCLNQSCPYNEKGNSRCPFYRNKEELRSCEVIITNHSLLLADMAMDGGVLPYAIDEYFLCIDEGHSFADIAIRSFMGNFMLKATIDSYRELSSMLFNPQKIISLVNDVSLFNQLYECTQDIIEELNHVVYFLSQNLHLFQNERLLLNPYLNSDIPSDFFGYFRNCTLLGECLLAGLSKIRDKLKEKLKNDSEVVFQGDFNIIGGYIGLVEQLLTTSIYMINVDDSRYNANARWIEFKKSTGHDLDFMIFAGVTHVGNLLLDKMWNNAYGVLVTSATLAIGEDFSYYMRKLGLNLYKNLKCVKLATSFDYTKQGQLVIPNFNYTPDYATRNEFVSELTEYLARALNYAEGYGTLVLFFNRNQLQEVYRTLPHKIQKNILLQTDFLGVSKLIEEHKHRIDQKKPSIIFGMNSFAEGVDLPSTYCMHVIITKLPFEPVNDPIHLVQDYWVKTENGSYFMEVSLPEVGIKLIQASGRLIRGEDDYGQISICDNRIITKYYGKILINALPNFGQNIAKNFIQNAYLNVLS